MIKLWILLLFLVLSVGTVPAQTPVWQPSSEHTQVSIRPGAVPDAQPAPGAESMKTDSNFLVAGRHVMGVDNVTRPTMTVYAPTGTNTGAAVVFPRGRFCGIGNRPGGHGGLRLANVRRDHLRAAEVPRAEFAL